MTPLKMAMRTWASARCCHHLGDLARLGTFLAQHLDEADGRDALADDRVGLVVAAGGRGAERPRARDRAPLTRKDMNTIATTAMSPSRQLEREQHDTYMTMRRPVEICAGTGRRPGCRAAPGGQRADEITEPLADHEGEVAVDERREAPVRMRMAAPCTTREVAQLLMK
jgi:hypothetical protein